MDDAIPEFDFSEIVRSRESQNVTSSENEGITADTPRAVKKGTRDPQIVHLLKKVNVQSTFLCIVLPLFSLFKLLLSRPVWNAKLLQCMAVYMFASQISLVAGYHRFFTHASFQCDYIIQLIFAILGGSCGLGSILDFSSQHLAHHHYIDTERDPHSCVVHGWLFSQWGHKLFQGNRKSARAVQECRNTLESTAKANSGKSEVRSLAPPIFALLRWQDEKYAEILVLTIILIPCIIAKFCKVPYLSGIFYLGLVRMSLIQQQWLLIGSLCHLKKFPFATQPFDDSRSAVNLPLAIIMDVLTFGESNHNFHHEFPGDFRNGPSICRWDPAKFVILLLYHLGLTGKLHACLLYTSRCV